MFTWIPFYQELSSKLLQFRHNRKPLVDWIYANLQGYINHVKDNNEGKRVSDIDPFTTFAIFNRQITDDKRKSICQKFRDWLDIECEIPADFDGIPVMNNQRSNFMAFEENRKEGDIERLWLLFEKAVKDEDIEEVFNQLRNQYLINFTLTMGLFWIRPDKYLALDGNNRHFLTTHEISVDPYDVPEYEKYEKLLSVVRSKIVDGSYHVRNFVELSYHVWKMTQDASKAAEGEITYNDVRKWVISPGENACMWERCKDEGEISIDWDGTGDLREYSSQEEYAEMLRKLYNNPGCSYKNDSKCLYEFTHMMKPGDIVFAKKGTGKILGRGIVEGEYNFDPSRDKYKHVRKVRWTHVGSWEAPWRFTNKTMTEIGRFKDECKQVEDLFLGDNVKADPPVVESDSHYWFITASPKVWSLSEWPADGIQGYSLYNDRGNRRRIFQNFLDAAAGDPVICYESSPTKQIKCIAEVVDKNDGKELNIRLTKTLASPIELADFKDHPELKDMEFFKGNQGSFFKLTRTEYEALMDLIGETNQVEVKEGLPKYTDADFLREVFTTADSLDEMKHLLRRKKNIILQGAPGVGKTFSAKRLAYVMMGEKNDGNIALVQFHQNYSYEDFIMGYKPDGSDFVLKEGVFFRFCRKALSNPEHDYFFIIDEINRGNMSKIFGELLMLIEKDYRGTYATLPYREERFTVPKNVYLIGMMNTADRSLAMIDYALRRRFSFVELEPGFESEGFRAYQQELHSDLFDRVVALIKQLNETICGDDTLGAGFQIGHSYLCGMKPEDCNEALLKEIVKYDILPTLSEYWFDDAEKIKEWTKKFNDLFA